MKNEYAHIFGQRGSSYDKAMHLFPDARNNEFLRLFDEVDFNAIQQILDVPAGGGYLRKYVPESVEIHYIEPTKAFKRNNSHLISNVNLDALVLPENSFDMVVSLAAIHHIKNKFSFVQSCYKTLNYGGQLVIGDVEKHSGIAHFLDNFVGTHSGDAHNGMYLNLDSIYNLAHKLRIPLIDVSVKPCPWVFEHQTNMLQFCRLLFGLKTVTDTELLAALNEYVGISEKKGKWILHWELLYAVFERNK